MKWSTCFTHKRSRDSKSPEISRTEFIRDFDRLIFASSFRRLQNKTQVFPLPGSTFVHNRLTHSLEVSSVGRSLGLIVGQYLAEHEIESSDAISQQFYRFDLSSVIAAACLAHDIGNPSFGHSGEKAISNYFLTHAEDVIEGDSLQAHFSEVQWQDLIDFEGNANALRVLTHAYHNKPISGMGLTYTTLASILKYPCESIAADKSAPHRKKYGFFQSEKETMIDIAEELQMLRESENPLVFKRHPFVYLVEAADDICYRIIDMEDAHRLGIIKKDIISSLFINLLTQLGENRTHILSSYDRIKDPNDSMAYLRAKTINALTQACAKIFVEDREAIISGSFNSTLLDELEKRCPALIEIMDISIQKIYSHHSVVEIEITGYHVMSHLLGLFVPAVLRKSKKGTDKMALLLIPDQFREFERTDDPYVKVLSIVDFIAGMTDSYATEFYRKTTGIDISKH